MDGTESWEGLRQPRQFLQNYGREQEQRFREQQAMRLRYQARRLNDEILSITSNY